MKRTLLIIGAYAICVALHGQDIMNRPTSNRSDSVAHCRVLSPSNRDAASNGTPEFCAYKELILQSVNRILKEYPEARLQDIYKSFYQSRFGPGHMIADTAMARRYLAHEMSSVSEIDTPLYEPTGVGGRYVRVYLSAVTLGKLTEDELCEAFIQSANMPREADFEWWKEWEDIVAVMRLSGIVLPDFNTDEPRLRALSLDNRAVHHSEAYNSAYEPHYRIVSQEIFDREIKSKFGR